ncbi:hypothetical protein Mapa_001687 [Marchantia paleacea]|nr:hypothetical protein Mapa_001687 [Marchantia paleacea]
MALYSSVFSACSSLIEAGNLDLQFRIRTIYILSSNSDKLNASFFRSGMTPVLLSCDIRIYECVVSSCFTFTFPVTVHSLLVPRYSILGAIIDRGPVGVRHQLC